MENKQAISVKLLFGYFEDDLPKQVAKQIRIFISSTFKDFKMETNYITEHIYGQLRDICLKKFQKELYLVNMRWGITDEVARQHLSTEMIIDELERCFQSFGPSFVALFGNRYGSRGLPSSIHENHFQLIKIKAKKLTYKGCDSLLDFLYLLDENDTGGKYFKLRRIHEIIKFFNIDIEEWMKQEKELRKIIYETIESLKTGEDNELKNIFSVSANHHEISTGILNREESNNKSIALFRSIENIPNKNVKNESDKIKDFCEIDGEKLERLKQFKKIIEAKVTNQTGHYFKVDWIKSNNFNEPFNEYTNSYLKDFRESFTKSILYLIEKNISLPNEANQQKYNQEILHHSLLCNKFSKSGLERDNSLLEKIQLYIDDDTNKKPFFIIGPSGSGKSTLMAKIARKLSKRYLENPTLSELVIHFNREENKFEAQQEIYNDKSIDKKLAKNRRESPSDSVKSKLLSRVSKTVRTFASNYFKNYESASNTKNEVVSKLATCFFKNEKFEYETNLSKILRNRRYIVLMRFLGTTRESSNIRSVMKSLITQLQSIFKVGLKFNLNENDNVSDDETPTSVRNHLMETLVSATRILKDSNQKIIILLDGIHQLSRHDDTLEWMLFDLPERVKIIFTIISNCSDVLPEIDQCNRINYMQMPEMNKNEAHEMINKLFKEKNRKLNKEQQNAINKHLQNTKELQPLYVQLLFDISSKWSSSYVVPKEFNECNNIKNSIKYIFKQLENSHGEMLFSRCIFYLTLFEYNGISESELEDILSIDDDVLESVFVNHHPSIRRFPNSLWLFIKHELANYLTHKEIDDVPVVSWFHRAFIEAPQEYYQQMFKPSEARDKILMNIIDYFTEKWNEKRSNEEKGEMKEFKYTKHKLNSFKEKGDGVTYYAYRNTKPQQIINLIKRDGKMAFQLNKRILNELVHIISMIENSKKKIDLFKKLVYLNDEFKSCKPNLKEMKFLIDMYNQRGVLRRRIEDLFDASKIYTNNYLDIQHDPSVLYDSITSRLESRSNYVQNFAAANGILLLQPYIDKDNESSRTVFIGSHFFSNKFRVQHDGPYLFIETLTTDEYGYNTRVLRYYPVKDSICALFIVNSINGRKVCNLEFYTYVDHMNIVLFDQSDKKDANQLDNINGILYFVHENRLYSQIFDSNSKYINNLDEQESQAYDDDIFDLLILSKDCILIVLKSQLKLSNGKDVVFDREIIFVESTIPNDRVFTADYLNKVDYVYVVVGLDTKIIHIYKFNTKKNELSPFCQIDDIDWDLLDYGLFTNQAFYQYKEYRPILTINDTYLITNLTDNKTNKIQLEFAIQCTEGIVKLIRVNNRESEGKYPNDGEYSIYDKIDDTKLSITEDEKDGRDFNSIFDYRFEMIRLESFFKDKVLLKVNVGQLTWVVYLYDPKKGNFVYGQIDNAQIIYSISNDIIMARKFANIDLYQINENNIKMIFNISCGRYTTNNRTDYLIRNNKLIRMDQMGRIGTDECYSGIKIIEYDYLTPFKKTNKLYTQKIFSFMDEKHALIMIKRDDDKFEAAIVDVTNNIVLDTLFIDVKIGNCKEGYNITYEGDKDFLIIINWKAGCLTVYKINKSELYEFKQIYKKEIGSEICKSQYHDAYFRHAVTQLGCYKNRFLIGLTLEDYLTEIILIEFGTNLDDKYIEKSFKIDNKRIFNVKEILLLNDFILVCLKRQCVIFYDIEHGKEVYELVNIRNLHFLKNSNNTIAVKETSLYFIELFNSTATNERIKHKEYKLKEYYDWVISKCEENYLILNVGNEYIQIYEFNDLKLSTTLTEPILINQCCFFIERSCLSFDKKYFLIQCGAKELFVYDLKLKKIKSLLKLQSYDFCDAVSSGKYILLILLNKNKKNELVTYEII